MSIWRSAMAARASLSRYSFSNHSLPSSQTLFTLFLRPTSLSSPQFPLPRFFSQISDPDFDLSVSPEISGLDDALPAPEQLPELADAGDARLEDLVPADEAKPVVVDEERLERLVQLLQSSFGVEERFDGLDLKLSQEFVVRVLETPLISFENLVGFVNWGLREKRSEFGVTPRVVDLLVGAVSENDVSERVVCLLWDLVKEIGENESDVLSAETLNKLIALTTNLGGDEYDVEVFRKFGDFNIVLNEDSYYFIIEALCKHSMYDLACSFCEKMVEEEKVPENEKLGKIISWLCEGNRAKDAHLVYVLAKEKKGAPPIYSIHSLVASLCLKDDTVRLALEILDDFEGEERKFAIKTFWSVIRVLCRMKDMVEAKKLLLKMITDGPPPGHAVFNSVLHGYTKAGGMEKALEIVELMKKRGLRPDVYTYTGLISGYSNGGKMEAACKVLEEAQKQLPKLSPLLYYSIIRGYCNLEAFDKALVLLADMENRGVQAGAEEYSHLIQTICLKALDWETAEKLYEDMKEKGLHLDGNTRGLIRAVKEMVAEEVETAKI